MPSFADRFARLVSVVSSPFIILSLFGVLSIAATPHTPEQLRLRISLFLLLVLGLPLAYIGMAVRSGRITDLHVMVRTQRPGPFMAALAGSFLLLAAYLALSVPQLLLAMTVSMIVCGAIFALVTVYWKISIHAAGYAGGVLMFNLVSGKAGALWLLLALPVIIWSRTRRERHTLYQGIMAAVLVCLCVYSTFRLVAKI